MSEFALNRERINLTLRKYWKVFVVLFVILGFSTVLPINVGKPNFLSAFTFCSFAPVATIAMFVLALTIYLFVKRRKLLLYGNVAVLLVIVLFTGFWVYDAKLPMDNISVDMSIYHYYFGYGDAFKKNVSSISFNLLLHNTLMRETPPFRVEYYDFYVNGRKLQVDTYEVFTSGRSPLFRWIGPFVTLGPNQTTTLEVILILLFDYTKLEGGTIQDIWTPLSDKNFTLRMDGILVSRTYYDPEYTDFSIVWVSTPFSLKYTYTE